MYGKTIAANRAARHEYFIDETVETGIVHKKEILRLRQRVEQKGCTLVPLRLYYKDALIKVELGVCRGKHTYDKKKTLMEKDVRRKAEREIKEYSR